VVAGSLRASGASRYDVHPLTQQPVKVRACVFVTATVQRCGKRHLTGLGGNAQVFEQRREVGVAAFVVDDEACIYRCETALGRTIHGIGMSADPAVFLIYGNPVTLVEKPCRRHARNAGTDDCDIQAPMFGRDGTVQRDFFL
jgi:hypothetical protein